MKVRHIFRICVVIALGAVAARAQAPTTYTLGNINCPDVQPIIPQPLSVPQDLPTPSPWAVQDAENPSQAPSQFNRPAQMNPFFNRPAQLNSQQFNRPAPGSSEPTSAAQSASQTAHTTTASLPQSTASSYTTLPCTETAQTPPAPEQPYVPVAVTGPPPPPGSGFIVDTDSKGGRCSDAYSDAQGTNPATPFCTLERAQVAMENAG